MQGSIKNIIFDLGGVLLNIDYTAPVREFEKLGVKNFDSLYSKSAQSSVFDLFETGKISDHKFRESIREISGLSLSDSQIDQAWNSILLDLPKERINLLKELKANYRIFLLSNTNHIHIRAFENDLIKEYGSNVFKELFEGLHYSSELGMRKPHVETFQEILKLHRLKPEETLFIDDSIQHVEGAKKAGLQSQWLDVKNTDILQFCQKNNLISR